MVENLKDAVDSKAPLAAAERKNEQSLNEKIDAILSRVAQDVEKYVKNEKANPESNISTKLKEIKNIKKSLGIEKMPLYIIPGSAGELSRRLGNEVIENIASEASNTAFALEPLLLKSMAEALAYKISETAETMNTTGANIPSFEELIAGLYLMVENIEKYNAVDAKKWYDFGNRYATFVDILLMVQSGANAEEDTEAEEEKPKKNEISIDDALNSKISKLWDAGFILDEKSLASAWSKISEKYGLDKLSATSSFEGFLRLIHYENTPSLSDIIQGQYEKGLVEAKMNLDLFILSEAANMLLQKLEEFTDLATESDEEEYLVKKIRKALMIELNKAKLKNNVTAEFLKIFKDAVGTLTRKPSENQIPDKKTIDGMYG